MTLLLFYMRVSVFYADACYIVLANQIALCSFVSDK